MSDIGRRATWLGYVLVIALILLAFRVYWLAA